MVRIMSGITYTDSDEECSNCGQNRTMLIAYKDEHGESQNAVWCRYCGLVDGLTGDNPKRKIGLKKITSSEIIEKLSKWTRKRKS